MLWRINSHLIEKYMIPYFLHELPILYNAIVNGIIKIKYPSFRSSLISNKLLFGHVWQHDSFIFGKTDDRLNYYFWFSIWQQSTLNIVSSIIHYHYILDFLHSVLYYFIRNNCFVSQYYNNLIKILIWASFQNKTAFYFICCY